MSPLRAAAATLCGGDGISTMAIFSQWKALFTFCTLRRRRTRREAKTSGRIARPKRISWVSINLKIGHEHTHGPDIRAGDPVGAVQDSATAASVQVDRLGSGRHGSGCKSVDQSLNTRLVAAESDGNIDDDVMLSGQRVEKLEVAHGTENSLDLEGLKEGLLLWSADDGGNGGRVLGLQEVVDDGAYELRLASFKGVGRWQTHLRCIRLRQ